MTKILLFILFYILVSNVVIETIPIIVDENEDIMASLIRLHQQIDRVRRRLNPMPDLITFASNDIADRLKRYVRTKNLEEETDTVYVSLKVDSEEDLETKYVNLYIDTKRDINANYVHLDDVPDYVDTKRDINANYVHLDDDPDYVDTKIVYLNISSGSNNKPYSSYRRFGRHRRL